ncbi:MAG: lamin tail domain-containing protein, partial [Planctomycetota bacterium]
MDSRIATECAAVPPTFNLQGGHFNHSLNLAMTAPYGMIYYTMEGSDPRQSQQNNSTGTTLVAENADKRVLVPTGPVSNNWKSATAFNDLAWLQCTGSPGGVGYERTSGYGHLISLDVESLMYNRNTTCYIRIPFTVSGNPNDFNLMTLNMRYDDDFVAYINGVEVQRAFFAGTPAWNSNAGGSHEADGLESFDVSKHINALRQGDNILAIHGLNTSTTSSDFLITAELIATASSPNTGGIKYTGPITLTKSTHVKARILSGNTWSALNEAIFAIGPVADNLRITEIMYHPQNLADPNDPNDPNEEYIELKNIGAETINLNLVSFTNGIDFTFPSLELAAGQYCVLVQDRSAFEARYGTAINIAGQYSGRLNNGGEGIRLEDAIGGTIL